MSNTGLRGHQSKLYKPQRHLEIRKSFLSAEWNHLPEETLHRSTLQTFKKNLDCYLKNRGYD